MVLGAELGKRLKKKVRETERSLPKARFCLKTLGARCPRPDPAGRCRAASAPPTSGAGRARMLRGRSAGAGAAPAPPAAHRRARAAGAPIARLGREPREGLGIWSRGRAPGVGWFGRGLGSTWEGNIWWESGGSCAEEPLYPSSFSSRLSPAQTPRRGPAGCVSGWRRPAPGRQLQREVAFPRARPIALLPTPATSPPEPAKPARVRERRGFVARVRRLPPRLPCPVRSPLARTQRGSGQLSRSPRVLLLANAGPSRRRPRGWLHPVSLFFQVSWLFYGLVFALVGLIVGTGGAGKTKAAAPRPREPTQAEAGGPSA